MRHARLLVILLTVGLTAAACSSGETTETTETTQAGDVTTTAGGAGETTTTTADAPEPPAEALSLVVGVGREAPSLDPALNPICCGYENAALYDTLVALLPDGTIGPSLAESWTIDGASITFELRQDVSFHDGTPFNAEAVKAYLDRVVDPATNAANALNVLGPYAGSDVVDDFTITIRWDPIYAPALVNLANTSLGIPSPTATAAGTLEAHPVGTGPFEFVEWVRGDRLTLKRYDGYTTIRDDLANKGPAYAEEVTLRYIDNATTLANLLETGVVDIAALEGPDAIRLESAGELGTFRYPTVFLRWFAINTANITDIRVREAIASSIDREGMVAAGAGGLATPHYSTVNSLAFGYDGSVDEVVPHYDLDAVTRLMEEAGYELVGGRWSQDGVPFPTMVLVTFSVDPYRQEAVLVQDYLRQAGFQVEIRAIEVASAISEVRAGNHDLYLARYGMFDAGTLRNLFHSGNTPTVNPTGNNITFYDDPVLDALLEEGGQETDPARRIEIYSEAQRQLASAMSTFALYEAQALLLFQPGVEGVAIHQDGALKLSELKKG